MNLKELKFLFKKVDGINVLKRYKYANVICFALLETILIGFSKKSLEIVRLAVNNRIFNRLKKEYTPFIEDFKRKNIISKRKKKSSIIWFCWFQGIENAPFIVKKCYESILNNINDRKIILITEKNYKEYISFPEFIQEKIDNKIINGAHFSDLMRLELLLKYGGTWIDATVFCTSNNIPKYMLDSELFLFQCLKPGLDGHATSISSWFITSYSDNVIIRLTRDLLYEYWKKNNKLLDYFLLHDMFQLAIETYHEEWKKVIPFSNSIPHILLLRLFDEYDKNIWNEIKLMTPFHKLTYKFEEDKTKIKNSYYNFIINEKEDDKYDGDKEK